jgi:predicted NodU family carbamoyl transferase
MDILGISCFYHDSAACMRDPIGVDMDKGIGCANREILEMKAVE